MYLTGVKCIKQLITDLKEEIHDSTIIVGYFALDLSQKADKLL